MQHAEELRSRRAALLPASFRGFLLSQNVIALKRLLPTISVAHCNYAE